MIDAGRGYHLITYGCQMNEYDSEVIAAAAEGLGYQRVAEPHEADLIIMNTCCIRENADVKVYGRVGEFAELKRRNPELLLAVTGCLAQKDGEAFAARFPQVDVVVGTHNLADLGGLLAMARAGRGSQVRVGRVGRDTELPVRREGTVSAWVPISVGCSNVCTFCIVPYVRGKLVSRPLPLIVQEVERAVAEGYVEVTLLGQNVNAYGTDTPRERPNFADVLRAVDAVPGLQRLRFTSPYPSMFTDEVIEAIGALPTVCEHVHLPLQSGHDEVLARMKRWYTTAQYAERLARIRDRIPDVTVTTDIIAGFPGETEAQFQETLDFVESCRFDNAFLFAYSPRAHTVGALLPNQVPEPVRMERLHRVIALQNRITEAHHRARAGRTAEVLVEGPSKKDPRKVLARTRGRHVVHFKGGAELTGRLLPVTLTRAALWGFEAEPSAVETEPSAFAMAAGVSA